MRDGLTAIVLHSLVRLGVAASGRRGLDASLVEANRRKALSIETTAIPRLVAWTGVSRGCKM